MFDAGAIVFHIRAAGAALFRQEMSEADKATERLGKSSETASSKTEELGKKQETAAEKARRLAKEQADAAAKAKDYAEAQDHVGKVLVTAGAAIVATTALTVKSAIDWQTAWTGVTKTVEGTPEELAAVEDGLRALTGVLPGSHDEIAAVAEAAGQLGVKTQDVVRFTRTMVDLGETTNLTSDQAATALAQLMNIMGTAGEDVDRLGSTIVALGNDGASTEAEIVQMAQRIAGSGKLVGATEGEVLALSNALASMGVTAELGGGVASRILQDLYSAVQTGGERLDYFAEVAGMSAKDFATAFENDPVRAMGAFATGLNGVEASGGNVVQTLSDLGFKSTEEQRVLLQLKSSGDLLTKSLDLQADAWRDNSALTEEASKRYDTVEAKLGIMRNRVNEAAIDLGSVFLPVLAEGAEAVGGFADTIASLDPETQKLIAGGTLAAGAVALLGGTALVAVPKVVELMGQIKLLATTSTGLTANLGRAATFLTGPWGLAFLAATVGMVALQNQIDRTKASTEEFQNIIANTKSVNELFDATESDWAIFSRLEEAIADADTFKSKLDIIANNDFLRGLDGAASTLKGSLQDIGKELASTASKDLPAAQHAFRLLSEEYNLNAEEQQWLLNTMGEYKTALVDVANQQGINVTSADEAANATKLLELAQGDGADQSESAARAYIEAADGASQLEGDLQELLDLLNEANKVGQDAITANIDYRNALADVDEVIQNARNGVEGYALTLDENTQAGRDNMGMLVDMAANAWDVVEADLAHGDSIEQVRSKLTASREDLIQRAIDLGYTRDEAVALADKILAIPTETEWTAYVQTQQAQQQIDNFVNLNGKKTINVGFSVQTQALNDAFARTMGWAGADGGVRYYANGGVSENHVAQIARAGEYRIWAEDETGGEGYVPLAPSKRARSEQIMAEIASRFGGTYIPGGAQQYADGAVVPDGPASAGSRTFVFPTTIHHGDPRFAVRQVSDEFRREFGSE